MFNVILNIYQHILVLVSTLRPIQILAFLLALIST